MGNTERVVEVFNQYLRQDDGGDASSVAPSLVTYNLVSTFPPPSAAMASYAAPLLWSGLNSRRVARPCPHGSVSFLAWLQLVRTLLSIGHGLYVQHSSAWSQ